jgi:hypothetical protein
VIRPFQSRQDGSTVRMGLPPITFTVGDKVDPVEYLKRDHAELLVSPMSVDLYAEGGDKPIWESAPHA